MLSCNNVSNDGQYHVFMNYDIGMLAYIISPKR